MRLIYTLIFFNKNYLCSSRNLYGLNNNYSYQINIQFTV